MCSFIRPIVWPRPIDRVRHDDADFPHLCQDILRDITQKVWEELRELCDEPPVINFHLTSIFDHSLYVCLSRIIQRHLPESTALESLLDIFCNVTFPLASYKLIISIYPHLEFQSRKSLYIRHESKVVYCGRFVARRSEGL